MTDYREVRTTQQEQGQEQRVATFKVTQLIWLLLGILESLIALRVVFKLLGVNAANPFASLLYNVTDIFVAPFASLIGAPAAGGMVLEISSILAMFIYLLVGWAFAKIVDVLFYRPRGPVTLNQTSIAEHTPLQTPLGVTRTITTDRTPTQINTGTNQTTIEHTDTLTGPR